MGERYGLGGAVRHCVVQARVCDRRRYGSMRRRYQFDHLDPFHVTGDVGHLDRGLCVRDVRLPIIKCGV